MADYYYRSGATNFNDNASWSTTSGGGADGVIPTNADKAIFDGSSNNTCTLSATTIINDLDTSLWTGNIALQTFQLTVEITTVLSANTTFTQSGFGALNIGVSASTTTTFTGNGAATIPRVNIIGTTDVVTITDQLDATTGTITNANPAVRLDGGIFNIYGNASLNGTDDASTTQINILTASGGANLSFAGARSISNNTLIKPTGTLTFTGTMVRFGSCELVVDLSSGGSISQGSVSLRIENDVTIDPGGHTWGLIEFVSDGDTQLDSVLAASKITITGLALSTKTFSGGFGFDVNELEWVNPNMSARELHLEEGVLYNINTLFTFNATAGAMTLRSTSTTVKSRLTMPTACVKALTGSVTVNDIDSSEGDTVYVNRNVTLSDTINWDFKPSANFFAFF